MGREIRVKCRGKKIEVVTDGFGGDGCRTAVQPLVDRLGGKVTRDENTEDFYRAEATHDVDQSNG